MRNKKLWKILGIGLGLPVTLLVLFVTAFVFNPFEGALPDMRQLVPRKVDFFFRKTDLKKDFTNFPEPAFWGEFASSPSWKKLSRTQLIGQMQRDMDIERVVKELRGIRAQMKVDSMGFADLLDDVLGEEVILAGMFSGSTIDRATWCAYARVSWKARFAWGLIDWGMVQDAVRAQGIGFELIEGSTAFKLTPKGGKPFFIARHLDCVMVSNDQAFLDSSLELVRDPDAESFGGSADYRDDVTGRITAWEQMAGVKANAVELYLQPQRLFERTRWDDNWPDANHKEDMNQRVLASFLNLGGWTRMASSFIFESEPSSLTMLGRISLNRNEHSPFQQKFFKAEAQDRDRWLLPFLQMVPQGSCGAAAIRMPAGDFLEQMFDALEAPERELLDDQLVRTGKYDGVRDLITRLRPALEPRTGFVFYRKRSLGSEIRSNDPSSAPHIAWVFWLRDGARAPLVDLHKFVYDNNRALGFTNAYTINARGGQGGDAILELVNPNIPGTGMIALLVYGNFFVLSNSSYLVKDMIATRNGEQPSILELPDYEVFKQELPQRMNGFVFLQGKRLAEVFKDYLDDMDSGSEAPTQQFMTDVRMSTEREVYKADYSRYGSISKIPNSKLDAFEKDVEDAMNKKWAARRGSYTAGDRAFFEESMAVCELFSSGYIQLSLDAQNLEWTSRFLFDF